MASRLRIAWHLPSSRSAACAAAAAGTWRDGRGMARPAAGAGRARHPQFDSLQPAAAHLIARGNNLDERYRTKMEEGLSRWGAPAQALAVVAWQLVPA